MKTHVMRIFTDASYINQSQIGSISYVVTIDNKEIKRFSEPYHQKANIFFLECLAISKAIMNTLKEYPSANIEIYTDSIPPSRSRQNRKRNIRNMLIFQNLFTRNSQIITSLIIMCVLIKSKVNLFLEISIA